MAATGSGVASFALSTAGALTSWGTSVRGQLGAGPAARSTPAAAPGGAPYCISPPVSGGRWVTVAAGWGHAAAVDAGGGLATWGHNADGQLGRAAGAATDRFVPGRVAAPTGGGGGGWAGVACGLDHTVGLDAGGGVHTWGCDAHGETGRPPRRQLPVEGCGRGGGGGRREGEDSGEGVATRWAAGGWEPAIRRGSEASPELFSSAAPAADTAASPAPFPGPQRLSGIPPVAVVAAGFAHTLLAAAPAAGGGIWACGWNGDGQLGVGGATFPGGASPTPADGGGSEPPADCVTTPTLLPASEGVVVTRLSAGRIHSAAVIDDGRLFTWGGGLHGRLGLDDFSRYGLVRRWHGGGGWGVTGRGCAGAKSARTPGVWRRGAGGRSLCPMDGAAGWTDEGVWSSWGFPVCGWAFQAAP